MKYWMIVTVDTQIEWPPIKTTLDFMVQSLILRPTNNARRVPPTGRYSDRL